MDTVNIIKLSEKTIQIEWYKDGVLKSKNNYPPLLYAVANEEASRIYIRSYKIPFVNISVTPENLGINGEIQTNVQEAVILLNEFIGNFKSGGGASGIEINGITPEEGQFTITGEDIPVDPGDSQSLSEKIRELETGIETGSANGKYKGYFPTAQALGEQYPSPTVGEYAYAGSPYPGTVYECTTAGTWTNTGAVPPAPEQENWQQTDW
jgi:hypothetical protein